MRAVQVFCTGEICCMTSSMKTISARCSTFALARNMREVRIVPMRHCCRAAVRASGPAVKLRLTGTFPARSTPILANAPATEGGSRSPTIASCGHCFCAQRASNRLPTSAFPYVRSRPLESVMQKENHCRLAAAMNRRCSRSRAVRRYCTAAPPSSMTACRTSSAFAVDGSG